MASPHIATHYADTGEYAQKTSIGKHRSTFDGSISRYNLSGCMAIWIRSLKNAYGF